MVESKKKTSYFGKIGRYLGLVILGLLVMMVLFLGITTLAHNMSLKSEGNRIETYGEKLTIFDGEMNVVDEGAGDRTIFLLPGQGTATPYLDFKPLINELKTENRVVTIEPFGYGLSSQTKRTRTIEHYVEEIHEVAKKMGIKNYLLMGHSIAGLYAVNYAQSYPEEMLGFIGIDTSAPEQAWPGVDMRFFDFLKKAGIFRLLIKIDAEGSLGISKDNPDFEQTRLLTLKNLSSRNMSEELSELDNSFPKSKGLTYPEDMPVLLLVAKHPEPDKVIEGWLELHENQVEGLSNGKVIELEGPHYLHRAQLPEIVTQTKQFLETIGE